jgi:hypothetical protein
MSIADLDSSFLDKIHEWTLQYDHLEEIPTKLHGILKPTSLGIEEDESRQTFTDLRGTSDTLYLTKGHFLPSITN